MVVGELAHEKDLIIIGGGPGGYHAAIRAAQLGKTVTLIEKDQLGGVCLNKGCIPSKVFSHAAARLEAVSKDGMLGISSKGSEFDINKLINYKSQVVQQLRDGVAALCKANKIEIIKGSAFFLSDDRVGVESENSYEVYRFKQAILASGGEPVKLPGTPIPSKRVIDSHSFAEMKEVPESLIVCGNDYISLEMAMAYHSFGSKVTVVLSEGTIEFPFDSTINRELGRNFKKVGIALFKGYRLTEILEREESVTIRLDGTKGNKTVKAGYLLYSLGTKPRLAEIGIDRLGMEMTTNGFIKTDSLGKTSIRNIYAVGDVTDGPALAVKAIRQGKAAAETICGRQTETDLSFLPHIARTRPPIASAGLTQQEAEQQGWTVGVGEFSLAGNGYASILGKKEGLLKLVFDKDSSLLLGVHIIGEGAIELISSGIQSLEMAARDEDIIFPSYPHPSLNEALVEAAEAFRGEAIHVLPKKRKEKTQN